MAMLDKPQTARELIEWIKGAAKENGISLNKPIRFATAGKVYPDVLSVYTNDTNDGFWIDIE